MWCNSRRGGGSSGLIVIMTLTVVYPCNTKLCILGNIATLPSQLSVICACSSVCGNQHTPRLLLVPTKLEAAGALRAFGYVVQQWTVAAHFEQDNDGCWIEPAGA